MNTKNVIVILVILLNISIPNAIAESKGSILCEMNVASILDPINFDNVLIEKRYYFDQAMLGYIQKKVQILTTKSKSHEASCEIYSRNLYAYNNCKGNNPPRNFIVWLGSVLVSLDGAKWENTIFGRYQIDAMSICEQSQVFSCKKIRESNALLSQQSCHLFL